MAKKSDKATTTQGASSASLLTPDYTDWASILDVEADRWQTASAAARSGPKVLIANCAGIDPHATTVESLLAVALTLRGADVHVLLCDEALPACWNLYNHKLLPEEFAEFGPSRQLCGKCFQTGLEVFRPLGLKIHRYTDFYTEEEQKIAADVSSKVPIGEIKNFSYEGIRVGEHAFAGTLRYFSRGNLEGEPCGEAVLRRYLHASLSSMFALRRLLTTFPFVSVCGIHGVYVPEGIVGEVARSLNVRMVSWNDSYRKQTFIFSQYDTYHRTMLTEPTSLWKNMPWTEEMDAEIREYLHSRWYGTHDWITYTQDWSDDVLSVAAEMGIDFSKPCIGLLTNVIWDAQVHYSENAFATMLEWTLESIRYFSKRPDLQLIVRIHPAEVRASHKSKQFMADEIERAFPQLPKNVFVIRPDSSMNTYAAMMKCDSVIIYGTKAGVELASMGIPVIVAGEAWIRNKGLTLDANTPEEYFAILDKLPLRRRMSEEAVEQAKRYAYHFFFRCHIPVPVIHLSRGSAFTTLEISGLKELRSGHYPGLDVICDGIINGGPFIYPAERYVQTLVASGKFTANFSTHVSINDGAKPVVSVILISRGDSKSLNDALDSVYRQSDVGKHFELEVLVVDDGSSDASSPIANRYSGVRRIQADKRSRLSVLRNIGVKASTGRYVTFLDEGNSWADNRLWSQVAVLEKYPEFGAVYGQFVATGLGEDFLWPEASAAPAGLDLKAFALEESASPSFLTLRREALTSTGLFDEALDGLDDYDMLLRLAASVRIAFVSGPVGKVTTPGDASWVSRIRCGEFQKELPIVLNRAVARLPDQSNKTESAREIVSHWFAKIANRLDRDRKVEALNEHVFSFLRENPWMIADAEYRGGALAYASRALAETARDSGSVPDGVRRFCASVMSSQSGANKNGKAPAQRFLGDTLTQAAILMWEGRDFKAAAFTATYAISQDFGQIAQQIRGTSRRLRRTALTASP